MTISNEAVEAALNARMTFKNQRGMDNAANLMRHILEAAAPHMLAEAWQSAYRLGVDDERTSQANPGVAGCFCRSYPCQCIIEPARENPYRTTPRPATHSLEDVAAEFGIDLDELRKEAE